jgi:gamma-butyrobetaine dioxygenase
MKNPAAVKRIKSTPQSLTVEWASGEVGEFASLWLRDNLLEDRDPHSGQRLIDVTDLPESPRIRSAVAGDGVVSVEWESDPHLGSFAFDWLAEQAAGTASGTGSGSHQPELTPTLWLEGEVLDPITDFARAPLSALQGNAGARLAWLTRLLQQGIAFLSDVPAVEAAILEATALVGRVCETNYGLVFDVQSVPEPENLAYSDRGLGLHTDNPYREPVPGFQALHAMLASREGGDSLFADGFALAEYLRANDPVSFRQLSSTAVPFLYRAKGAELYAQRPLIQLSCRGAVSAVHYNSRSIAPLPLAAPAAEPFYAAYRRFAALLREPRYQLRCKLNDGDLVVFDNQRILHGRTGFSSAQYARHLRGCYLTRDSVYGETALLRRNLERESRG